MKYSIKIFGLLILVISQSCGLRNQSENISANKSEVDMFEKYSNDSIRSQIFEIAYNNKSTAPSYIVFKAMDLNSGLEKEICSEAPFLSGAMHKELNIGYDTKSEKYIDSIILSNKNKVFKFKDSLALENIGFESYYDYESIKVISLLENLDYFVEKFGSNDSIESLNYGNDRGYPQVVFAHILFKCGIITSRDCVAGNNIWFGNPNNTN